MGNKQKAKTAASNASKAAAGKGSVVAACPVDALGGAVFPERAIICAAICTCSAIGAKQWCVSKMLWGVDKAMGYKSTVKAEVPYDMSKRPPAPYMSRSDDRRATRRRVSDSRIPDVVVVKDGAKPPTQDNIKYVVEIKFPPDVYGTGQKKAYEKIAGSKSKLVTLSPKDCGCDKKKQPVKQPAPQPVLVPQNERSKEIAKKAVRDAGIVAGAAAAAAALAAALEAAGPYLIPILLF